jgi:hypothetical protein
MADPKKSLEDIQQLTGAIEEGFRDITDRIKNVVEEIRDASDELNLFNSVTKDITRSLRGMSKINESLTKNYTSMLNGQIDSKKIQEQINKVSAERLTLTDRLRSLQIKINEDGSATADQLEEIAKLESLITELSGEVADNFNKQLEISQRVEKTVGSMGKLLKGISKIPILGDLVDANSALEAMNRNILEGGNRLTALGAGLGSLGKSLLASLTDPLVVIGLIIKAFKTLVELGFKADTQVTNLSKSMAISKEEATALRDRFVEIQNTGNSLFETTENLVAAQLELASAFGATRGFSEQQVKDQVYLTKQIGLSVDEAASLQQIAMSNGLTADQVVKSTIKQTSSLAKQTGIQLDNKKVLGEVAKISGQLRLQYQNNPGLIAQAVVQTQKLGISLDQAKKMAEGLLNFESSIANELEAELVTGKDLNLEQARLLALNGKSAEAAAEMLKQVGGTAEFSKMNVIQQEALARALGMNADELANSLIQQENLNNLGEQNQTQIKAKVEELKAAGKVEEANQLMASIGDDKQAQAALERISAQDKFNAAIDKLKNMVASLVEGPMQKILDKIVNFVSNTERLKAAFSALKVVAVGIAAVLAGMAVAWAVMNPIGALAGLAAAALVGGVVYSKMSDGMIGPGGETVVSTKKGTYQLDKNDGMVIGTNIGRSSSGGGNSGGGTDISPLVVEMQNVKAVLNQILAKEGSVYMDSTKVGTTLTVGTYKTQ